MPLRNGPRGYGSVTKTLHWATVLAVLPLHVAAHVAFFVALAAHLGMVLGKGLLPRML